MPNQFTVAKFITVELKAGNFRYNGLKQTLAFKKRQARCVAAIKMQNVECVKHQARTALAIRRGLRGGNPHIPKPSSAAAQLTSTTYWGPGTDSVRPKRP
jgi:hypothetical protein